MLNKLNKCKARNSYFLLALLVFESKYQNVECRFPRLVSFFHLDAWYITILLIPHQYFALSQTVLNINYPVQNSNIIIACTMDLLC